MAGQCVDLPDLPALPPIDPFSLPFPPLPGLDLSIDYCCRFAVSAAIPIPDEVKALIKAQLSIPGAAGVILFVNQMTAKINAYKRALPLSCPFEDQAED